MSDRNLMPLKNSPIAVSVIIPTYNRRNTLARAVNSVRHQTYQPVEIIVVDDGSTDSTDLAFAGQNDIEFVSQPNLGVSQARNHGALKARGDWLAFLDSDDEWLPNKLALQIAEIQDYPELKWIHGEEIWLRDGQRVNPLSKHKKMGGRLFKRSVELCCVSPSTVMIRKDVFFAMGGFDRNFKACEDYDLWLKLSSRYNVGFIEDPVAIKYAGHDDQLSRTTPRLDEYRLTALTRHLDNPFLSSEEQIFLLTTCLNKISILKKGYLKHSNFTNWAQLLDQENLVLKALTANHKAYSQAHR